MYGEIAARDLQPEIWETPDPRATDHDFLLSHSGVSATIRIGYKLGHHGSAASQSAKDHPSNTNLPWHASIPDDA